MIFRYFHKKLSQFRSLPLNNSMNKLRKLKQSELLKVSEVLDRSKFLQRTLDLSRKGSSSTPLTLINGGINADGIKTVLKSGILTYLLHWY